MLPRTLTILPLFAFLAGCKLAIMVSSGGDVVSLSDTNNCGGSTICEIEIIDTTFSDSFTALPREGHAFASWASGDTFYCGGSSNPTCSVTTTQFAGNIDAEAIIAKNYLTYLVPEFRYVESYADIEDHLETPVVYDNAPGYPDFYGQTFISDGKHVVGFAFYAGIDTNPESAQSPIEGPADLLLYDVSNLNAPVLLKTSRFLEAGETASGLVLHDFDVPVPSSAGVTYFIGIGANTGFGVGLRSQTTSTYAGGAESSFNASGNQIDMHLSGRDFSFLVRGATL